MNTRLGKIGLFLLCIIFGLALANLSNYSRNLSTEIVVFGLGKADSIFIRNKGETLLIDTGTKDQAKTLENKLLGLRVEKLDYLVLTHPDKDHIGAAYHIIKKFKVDNLIQSKFQKGNKAELRLQEAIDKTWLKNTIIRGRKDYLFNIGDLRVTIYPPREDSYNKSNDYSLVVLIEEGDLRYLFAGDAEETLLAELLERDLEPVDLYKLPHHGRWNGNSQQMIGNVSPKFAVITNSQGDDRVLKALKDEGAEVFYAFDRDIGFTSDGKELKYKGDY